MEIPQLGFSIFIFFLLFSLVSSLNSDGLSLLALKTAITKDPHHTLSTWKETDTSPCKWVGISCSADRVTGISLPNKSFTGYIPSVLGSLDFLQHLSLSHNNFSNTIPSRLFNASFLLSLDLSGNSLSGSVPIEIKTLKTLTHLDLSDNALNGTLPLFLSELSSLAGTLNLSYNRFSGEIPESFGNFPVSVSLDVQHNNLSGRIPQIGSLLNQGPTAFAGNPNLCGFPLQTPCPELQNQNPTNPKTLQNPSNPSNVDDPLPKGRERGMSVPILFGVVFIVGTVFVSAWFVRKKWKAGEGKMVKGKSESEGEGQKGEFFVVDEGFRVELEELLRASAYVVGKSCNGIVYKVVVGRGVSVAVRRLSEGSGFWKFKDFGSEVEALARIRHPNLVRIQAYYYATDEKLLVSDFISNGTLHSALYGGSSNSPSHLPWATRLKIAQGSARGLAYLHEYSPRKYVHGNIKSSKILLDDDFEAYISGFGLTRLIAGTNKSSTQLGSGIGSNKIPALSSANYLAPEGRVSGNKLTQKCDVYSFGIVLLEILTGRSPDFHEMGLESFVRKAFQQERPLSEIVDPSLLHEVHAKKQVLAAFHVALGCTEKDPEVRPRMRTVSESLDRIGCH
ncbi:receptor protein kinase-like protein ZAR1 [Tasmannia lanceolata]|uniref:receptor protein kinase-like protein ZAR1 n=1 Tax=Tasmannia lanceolata TaxID=3420 RepID=UPI004062B771